MATSHLIPDTLSHLPLFNILKSKQNGKTAASLQNTFSRRIYYFCKEQFRLCFLFHPRGPIHETSALVQVMVWRRKCLRHMASSVLNE